ncbi:tetratricopeptide repeat protein [Fundidesulfovibrio agrisoli]|uniref:tetratricopeptide repeat protein n=1 Tax=Fundidesulfovibrio agrisoli TaxID=2922717 RepID=UPI001FAD4920|nr:tetratricopeptide repeat protein [Fundidesulfovibrio agrisoli]
MTKIDNAGVWRLGSNIPFLALLVVLIAMPGCSKFQRKMDSDKAKAEQSRQAASQLVTQAEAALAAGQLNAAIELLDQAAKSGYPKDAAELRKGKAYLSAGAYANAAKSFEEVLRIAPDNQEAAVLSGYSSFLAGDYAAAETRLAALIAKDQGNGYARYLLGATYNKTGKANLAVKEFQAVIAQTGGNQNILNNLGISYFILGQYDNAKDSFIRSLSFGHSKRTLNNLALTYCRMKRFDDAYKAFKASGGEAFALNNTGCCFIDVGDQQKAMEMFNKALNASPTIYKPAHDNIIRYGGQQESASVKPMQMPTEEPAPAAPPQAAGAIAPTATPQAAGPAAPAAPPQAAGPTGPAAQSAAPSMNAGAPATPSPPRTPVPLTGQ